MIWSGMVRNTSWMQHKLLVSDLRILSLEDPACRAALAPFRKACGLAIRHYSKSAWGERTASLVYDRMCN